MKTMQSITTLILATLLAGCSTLEVSYNGNGGGGADHGDITQQMASDSQGA